jgi:opacity protein-like surface antigen
MTKTIKFQNKLIIGAIALCAMTPSFSNFANAKDGKIYVGASYGLGFSSKKFDYDPTHDDIDPTKLKRSNIFGVAIGTSINKNFRAEIAVNHFQNFKYQANDKQSADMSYKNKITSTAVFLNSYYDIKEIKGFVPYITAGLGVAKNKSGILKIHEKDSETTPYAEGKAKTQFAWNVGAGIGYNLNERLTLDLINYKHYNLGSTSTEKDENGDLYGGKLKIHSISTGIRIKF